MKRTQLTDSLRNIRKQIVSYLSVVIIALLASSIFLGVSFASRTIFSNADRYYRESDYCDAKIYYNSGLRPEDIEYFGNIDGVRASEGEFEYIANLQYADEQYIVNTVSLTRNINTPIVLEGRLPEAPDECVIEQILADEAGISINDKISFDGESDLPLVMFPYDEYTVTGIIYHPDNLCIHEYTHNNPTVVIPLSGFDEQSRQGLFTSVLITFDGTEGLSRFSRQYQELTDEMREKLSPYLDEEASILYTATRDLYEDYRLQIEEGRVRLTDSREQIDEGWQALSQGEDELDASQMQLEDSAVQLEDARDTLDDSRIRLDSAEQQLEAGWQELQTNLARLEAAEAELAPHQAELESAQAELESTRLQLESAQEQLAVGAEQIRQASIDLDAGRQRLEEALDTLNITQAIVDAITEELPQTEEELADGDITANNLRAPFASALYLAMYEYIGDYADLFDWTVPDIHVDYHDPDAHLQIYPVTNSITVNLLNTPEAGIEDALILSGLSEEQLSDRYSSITGEPAVLPEGSSSWYQYLASVIMDQTVLLFPEYYDLLDAVGAWELQHGIYTNYPVMVADLQEGWNEYYAGLYEYNAGMEEYNRVIEYYNNSEAQYNDGLAQYEQGLSAYNQGLAEFEAARAQLDAGWAEYNDGLNRYNAARAEYDRNNALYEQGLAEYEDGLEQYNEGLEAYEEGLTEYNSSYEELLAAEEEYTQALEEFEDSELQFNNLSDLMEERSEIKYLYTGILMNASYKIIDRTGHNLDDIGHTFTLVFVVIAALVIFATLGRIVDEQRTQVGTTKALGFLNGEILRKYLVFGLSGTFIGTVLGTTLGYFVILPIVMRGYDHNYVYGSGTLSFIPSYAVITVAGGILLALGTIVFACFSTLRSTAITLLAERVPSAHKGRNRDKSTGPLYPKLILLNLLSDKKRVMATIVSILGCTTLLTAGFTLRNGINNALVNQFELYEHYDYKITFSAANNENAEEQIRDALVRNGAQYTTVSDHVMLSSLSNTLVPVEVIAGDLDQINTYFSLTNYYTHEQIDSSVPGLWINTRMREYYSLKPGDEISFYDSNFTQHKARIAGFYDAYIGFYVFMDNSYYAEVFNEEPAPNGYFAISNSAGEFNIESDINSISGIETFTDAIELKQSYLEKASSLSILSVLFTAMSAMLAYFILLNLVSMLVNQKKRELTIMRVNGFSLFQTINYVARELVICTVIGIIIGLLCGDRLGRLVLGLCESDQLTFDKTIQWEAWLFAALLTLFFTILISAPVFAKIRKLDLSDLTR